MNVVYIRAAIQQETGIRLTYKQVIAYLLEEKMITKAQSKRMLFPGYEKLFPAIPMNWDKEPETEPPVDAVIKD